MALADSRPGQGTPMCPDEGESNREEALNLLHGLFPALFETDNFVSQLVNTDDSLKLLSLSEREPFEHLIAEGDNFRLRYVLKDSGQWFLEFTRFGGRNDTVLQWSGMKEGSASYVYGDFAGLGNFALAPPSRFMVGHYWGPQWLRKGDLHDINFMRKMENSPPITGSFRITGATFEGNLTSVKYVLAGEANVLNFPLVVTPTRYK